MNLRPPLMCLLTPRLAILWRGLALLLFVLACPSLVMAFTTTRDAEIEECRPGEIQLWNDGVDRHAISSRLHLSYRHEGAPEWFSSSQVEAMVVGAAVAWSACGIAVDVLPADQLDLQDAGSIIVQWSEAGSRGNFALANLSERRLSISPKGFALLRQRNPGHDATQTLQMVISHEMGHFFGLMAHSRRCVDVLSYYHDGKGQKCFTRDGAGTAGYVEYRSVLPTACDIARCRATNELPSATPPVQQSIPPPLYPAPPIAKRY